MEFEPDKTVKDKCETFIKQSEEVFDGLESLSQSVGIDKAKQHTLLLLENIITKIDSLHPLPTARKEKKSASSYLLFVCKKTESYVQKNTKRKEGIHDGSQHDACQTTKRQKTMHDEETYISENNSHNEHSENETNSDNDSLSDDTLDCRDDLDHHAWQKDFINQAKIAQSECPRVRYKHSVKYNAITWILIIMLFWKVTFFVTDNAFNSLLSILAGIFQFMGMNSSYLRAVAAIFPKSLHMTRRWLALEDENFERFIGCSECYTLYPDINDLIYTSNNQLKAKTCSANIATGKRFKVCGNKLLQETILKDGTRSFLPLKTYCYKPITSSIESLLQRPGFETKCNAWRDREINDNQLGDIFDGQVWNDFKNYNGTDFFNVPNNYGLMLNIDWFQPYKRRSNISIGVIYLTVMNLPRKERFKLENAILVSVLPAFKHEPDKLDTFIKPLVDELQLLWAGCEMLTDKFPGGVKVRAALLCTAADIPASRKICGFLSHSAKMGCNKCYCEFEGGFAEKRNYSGFNVSEWKKRTHQEHLKHIAELRKCKTKSARILIERKYGVRITPFLDLPYYDSIRHNVIDPMHNIFLGVAKTMWRLWINNNHISQKNIEEISRKLRLLKTSHSTDTIPQCIGSNWSSFTAHEWKVWTLCCSMFCLQDILEKEHLLCWQQFVKACEHICKPCITRVDVQIAHLLLTSFCSKVEQLMGWEVLTPNMHLCCHMKESILDFGPIYGFWLFSFERYNGIMSTVSTNKLGIEVQLMRKFLQKGAIVDLLPKLPELEDGDVFKEICSKYCENDVTSKYDNAIVLPETSKLKCFDTDDLNLLISTYQQMYKDHIIQPNKQGYGYKRYNKLQIGNNNLKSMLVKKEALTTLAISKWYDNAPRPCVIKYFFTHLLNKTTTHTFAAVSWLIPVENNDTMEPFSMWSTAYERSSHASFMPINEIVSRAAYVKVDSSQLLVCPLIEKVYC